MMKLKLKDKVLWVNPALVDTVMPAMNGSKEVYVYAGNQVWTIDSHTAEQVVQMIAMA